MRLKPLAELESVSAQIVSLSSGYLTQAEVAEATAAGFDLVAISPAFPRISPCSKRRAARRSRCGRSGTRFGLFEGPRPGNYRNERKDHYHRAAGHLLKSAGIPAQVGGNIGTPVCDMIATSAGDRWNVLELSSFQLETTVSFRADIAVCLNVTPDHLDRHRTMENYIAQSAAF